MANRSPVFAPRLVIFAKAPALGAVKTRLARDVGFVEATRWYRHATADAVRRLARDRRWRTYISVSPDCSVRPADWQTVWGQTAMRIAQGRGDLGERMSRVFKRMPPGPVVIVGTDCLAMSNADIAAAFAALGEHDGVVGPATDGGYWLIGLKRLRTVHVAFEHVRWSTRHALEDTLRGLPGKSVARLRTLSDIDTGDDLQTWRAVTSNAL